MLASVSIVLPGITVGIVTPLGIPVMLVGSPVRLAGSAVVEAAAGSAMLSPSTCNAKADRNRTSFSVPFCLYTLNPGNAVPHLKLTQ